MNPNEEFKLPTNIKQIGSISDGLKVYMEDYVATYIQQYSGGNSVEKIAVLVGKGIVIDNEKVLFISGAIKGKYSKNENNIEALSVESWDYINEQMDNYFQGLEIVGWVYVQPGYGEYLNENLINYHMTNFKNEFSVLFLNDPVEKTNCFFSIENDDLTALNGYFIYFDRNEGMHEYMLDNRPLKLKEIDREKEELEQKAVRQEITPKLRNTRTRSKVIAEQKRMVNLFASLSAVLFLICFVMGAGLIQNDDRISELENKLSAIDTSYKYIVSQIKDDNAQSVFAAQQNNDIKEVAVSTTEAITELTTQLIQTTEAQKTTQTTQTTTQITTQAKTTFNVPDTYTVEAGDTLGHISRKFYGSEKMMTRIMEVNQLDDPNKIYFGKVIKLPKN